jgi:hypothetical protein
VNQGEFTPRRQSAVPLPESWEKPDRQSPRPAFWTMAEKKIVFPLIPDDILSIFA